MNKDTLSKTNSYYSGLQASIEKINVPLFMPKQVYKIEQDWFNEGNPSYGLMQQAAWQMAHWIYSNDTQRVSQDRTLQVGVWVGRGNNSGDGWLVASYLSQLGAEVSVIEVAEVSTEDAKRAKQQALADGIEVIAFADYTEYRLFGLDVCVDALFGIGLDRKPEGDYEAAINQINRLKQRLANQLTVISIDIPSGLVAGTGQVFDGCAVRADVTMCLVARKLGLHIKDAPDYVGHVIDIPLIPSVLSFTPDAWLQQKPHCIAQRDNNTHKGSFGHALIIGGNRIDGSQGMGGAALLSASAAFAVGVGKLSVACHERFHGSLITHLPNAMSMDLHDTKGVQSLIADCDAVAIGMGFGRDESSYTLFETYLAAAIDAGVNVIIDADGLYHLATIAVQNPTVIEQLKTHSNHHQVWLTPHSGEAARLLGVTVDEVEANRVQTIRKLADKYGGDWLLKGAGTIVLESGTVYVCGAGNPGMATAGMGDVLSGVAVGLLAQESLPDLTRCLHQAVLIHATAGDLLEQQVGTWALQANDMDKAIGQVMQQLTV